jgi:hypothetical protein
VALLSQRLFTDILKKSGDCMEIEFLEDGSWRPLKAKGSEPPSRSRSPVLDTSVQTIQGEFLSCFLLISLLQMIYLIIFCFQAKASSTQTKTQVSQHQDTKSGKHLAKRKDFDFALGCVFVSHFVSEIMKWCLRRMSHPAAKVNPRRRKSLTVTKIADLK